MARYTVLNQEQRDEREKMQEDNKTIWLVFEQRELVYYTDQTE